MVELSHESSIAGVLIFSSQSAVQIRDAHLVVLKFHGFENNWHRDGFRFVTHRRISNGLIVASADSDASTSA